MYNPFTLEGKVIMVTGASSGIGQKTAEVLDQMGARLVLVGRSEGKLNSTLNLMDKSRDHIVAPFDLKNTQEISNWLGQLTRDNLIQLDGVVHSAGLYQAVPLRLNETVHYEELMRVNLYAGIAILQGMLSKRVAIPAFSFVFISSVAGIVGQSGGTAYSASKGAVNAFVKSAALEVSKKKARVNAIAPGAVVSDMSDKLFESLNQEQQDKINNYHPLGLGSSQDVAYGAAYLLSDAARWVTGTTLTIDGGYTCH